MKQIIGLGSTKVSKTQIKSPISDSTISPTVSLQLGKKQFWLNHSLKFTLPKLK